MERRTPLQKARSEAEGYKGRVLQDRHRELDTERATMRIRLVGVALGSTLLLLAPRSDQVAAGVALLAYAAIATALRFAVPRAAASFLAPAGIVADVAFATALVMLLPRSGPSWAAYSIAIATGALRFGVHGAAAATATAVVAYDATLALRPGDAAASDLWPVQVLLAFGVLATELVWAVSRSGSERRILRAQALAQRDLASCATGDELLARLVEHAIRTFGARAAWIAGGSDAVIRHARGLIGDADARERPELALALSDDPRLELLAAFEPTVAEPWRVALADLARDAGPLLAAVRTRERQAAAIATGTSLAASLWRLSRDRDEAAVIAELVTASSEIAGPSAVVRPADGVVVAGDLEAERAVELARDGASDAGAVVTNAGPGLRLVATSARSLEDEDRAALQTLGEVGGAAIERIAERDQLAARVEDLDSRVAGLRQDLQGRDDAVASAVHELRTPLTSVQAYGQVMSRNLQAVQRQVVQLDRLLGDLLQTQAGAPRLDLAEVDLRREVREAASRLRLVAGAEVDMPSDDGQSYVVRGDAGRLAQVLDNLLRNAAKFSPPEEPIEVGLRREGADVVLSVTDRGAGIPPEEQSRIFERYYRGTGQRRTVPGEGIGLAVSREIIAAHGGRIWVDSPGPGEGSTFSIALPAIT